MKNLWEWFVDSELWKKIVVIILFIGLTAGCFLIGFSVRIVHPLEWGLKYNKYSQAVQTKKLWTSGKYFIGLGVEFIKFPRQQQNILFSSLVQKEKSSKQGAKFKDCAVNYGSFTARTNEGLNLTVDIYIGYTLTTADTDQAKAQQLWSIYSNYGKNWNQFLQMIITNTVRDIFSQYSALEIPSNRKSISTDIYTKLDTIFQQYYFTLKVVNLLNIEFPEDFESACTDYIIASQMKESKENQLATMEVQSETNLTATNIDAQILINKANTTAYVTQILKEAQANITTEKFSYYQEAFYYAKQTLSLTNDELMELLWIYLLKYNVANKTQLWTDISVS